jgi:Xaa-Pro aminopeptidase
LIGFFLLAMFAVPLFAQYTDKTAFEELGGAKEFARRRAALCEKLKGGNALLFSNILEPQGAHYREDNDFYYFTGISDLGSAVMINCQRSMAMLFEPEQPERVKQVYGANVLGLPKAEQAAFGFGMVMTIKNLDAVLTQIYGQGENELWLRLGFPDKVDGARPETGRDYADLYEHPYGEEVPLTRNQNKRLREHYPAAKMRDLTPMIDALRDIKTPQEIEILRRNGKISAEGDRRAIARTKPGMFEYEVEAEAYYWYYKNGAQGMAYPAIVGSGPNVNTWHYFQNRRKMEPNDLVVFDFGADLHHMTMDITRTYNVSGKFTPEQAKWYAVDLEAQKAIIDMLRPGNTYEQAGEAGKKVYEKAGIGDQYRQPGPQGHFVGLATHDVGRPAGPIKVGQVVTVEPIIEFPDKHIHIRIEDTVLITENGPEILTSGVPKEMADVERLVGSETRVGFKAVE